MSRTNLQIWSGTAALAMALLAACDDDKGPPITAAMPDAAVDAAPATEGGARAETITADAAGDTGPPPVADTDISVVRLNPNGTIDTTFGTNGVAKMDFGPGAGTARDSLWGMTVDAQNRVLLFGARKGDGRADNDRVAARLTASGALDTTFATLGMHTLNIANLNDAARNGFVQADGKIVTAGYTGQPTGVGIQTANRVVLLRLDGSGIPDPTFGFMGIVNSAPFMPADPIRTEWGISEAYSVAFQSGKYITTGYGRAAATGTLDMVSFRYTEAGALDTTWGTNGIVTLDIVGQDDRGRNLLVLPGDKVLIFGSGKPSAADINAMVLMLQPNGALDTSFDGDGYKLHDFGRPDEAFYGAALSPSKKWAAGAGYRAGMAGGVMEDDDATLLLFPVDPAAGAEVARAVPLSETQNDRFWGAAFDASDRAYFAGFVVEGGDSRMVVARYDMTGALDPTFGTAGVATINTSVGPGTAETARAVVLQSDGKVLIAGEAEKR